MGFGGGLGKNPVLLRRSGPAEPGDQAHLELGSVVQPAGHQLVLQIACAGPGSIDVSYLEEGVGAECMADDQSLTGYAIEAPQRDTTVTFTLHSDHGAPWRVAIYDLGP
jgi:hypothetical protein